MRIAPSNDRFTGVLVTAACADALGAGYEFGPPTPDSEAVLMRGQGGFGPGEWTDDTAQMIAIALAAAEGHDLDSPDGHEAVAAQLLRWYFSPAMLKDIGIHSSAVFGEVAAAKVPELARTFRRVALRKEERHPGSSGGNGALMRTAPVALALWSDPDRMVSAAMDLAGMTHADPHSTESCAVWCLAIRAALLADDPADLPGLATTLAADIRRYLPQSADYWVDVLAESYGTPTSDYYRARPGNGYCVTTLRAAWAAITGTAVPQEQPARHLRLAVEAAVRGGGDTDTVACVAGAVLGAMWGVSAVPLQWRRRIFGWPEMRDRDLVELAAAMAHGRDLTRWPHSSHMDQDQWVGADAFAVHPHDGMVALAGIGAASRRCDSAEAGPVTAIVSLCRVGRADLVAHEDTVYPADRVEVWLLDSNDPSDNPHLALVLDEAADAVAQFRAEGKRVLLHCVAAHSRTPSVAAHYSVRHLGVGPERALADVMQALPDARPNSAFVATVRPV